MDGPTGTHTAAALRRLFASGDAARVVRFVNRCHFIVASWRLTAREVVVVAAAAVGHDRRVWLVRNYASTGSW